MTKKFHACSTGAAPHRPNATEPEPLYALLTTRLAMLVLACASAVAGGHLSEEKMTAAAALLSQNGMDLDTELFVTEFISYKNGGGVVSGFQVHDGLPVFDHILTHHFGEGGELLHTMGDKQDLSDFSIDRDELLDVDAAVERLPDNGDAVTVRKCAQNENGIWADLGIYQRTATWRIKCADRRPQAVYLNATDGTPTGDSAAAMPDYRGTTL